MHAMSFGQGGPQGAPGDSQASAPQGAPPPGTPARPGPPPAAAGTPAPWPQAPALPQPQPAFAPPQPQTAQTPDWAALADDSAARDRRRKWLLIGGGVLATGAVAAIVATAVIKTGKGDKTLPAAEKLPSASPSAPEPSFSQVAPPPPPNPREFIASADKDKAPLTTKTLFPHSKPSLDKRSYDRAATDTTSDCASVGQGGLGQVLARNDCRKVLRATYVRDGVAVTVGVAVFDTKAKADQVKEQATGNIAALTEGEAPTFCQATSCRLTANAEGRYAYFTVAGYTNGSAVPSDDAKALQAGRDVAGYTFRRIMARANEQASAAAAPPKSSSQPSAKASASSQAKA